MFDNLDLPLKNEVNVSWLRPLWHHILIYGVCLLKKRLHESNLRWNILELEVWNWLEKIYLLVLLTNLKLFQHFLVFILFDRCEIAISNALNCGCSFSFIANERQFTKRCPWWNCRNPDKPLKFLHFDKLIIFFELILRKA